MGTTYTLSHQGDAGNPREPGAGSHRGQKAVVLGFARQGIAAARYLVGEGAEVTVSDLRDRAWLGDALDQVGDLPIRYELGGHPLWLLDEADLVCVSAGVPADIPLLLEARRRGLRITNEAQLFLERCRARVIGITGSAGKTTTTALVGEMCRRGGFHTWVGGNIGNPLISDAGAIGAQDLVVMELSSFQLEVMERSPQFGVVLNITPNHLDRHRTMEAYIAAKRNIVLHQTSEDLMLLGYDDANARSLARDVVGHLVWFSLAAQVEEGASGANGLLTVRYGGVEEVVCRHDEVRLLGRHNILNALAACAVARAAGVSLDAVRQAVTSFTGVEHRLEPVRELRGAKWYNDSIATAPERSLAALQSFEGPIVLLAGGRDKNLPWEELAAQIRRRVRALITFGEAGPMIAELVDRLAERGASQIGPRDGEMLETVMRARTLEDAVWAAADVARDGDVVLLSPGGTSFDAFRDFADRGDRFKELVRAL